MPRDPRIDELATDPDARVMVARSGRRRCFLAAWRSASQQKKAPNFRGSRGP
jgi:hypothetical protein